MGGQASTSRYVDSGRSREVPVSCLALVLSVSSFEAEAAAAAMLGRASAGRDASSCRCTPGSLSDSSGASPLAMLVVSPSSALTLSSGPLLSSLLLVFSLSELLARH